MEETLIVVVGASGGIGSELVRNLGQDFGVLGTFYSRPPSAKWEDAFLEWHDGDAWPPIVACDVTDEVSVQELVETATKMASRIVVVNASGISHNGMAHKTDPGAWLDTMAVNLDGAFYLARYFLPHMREVGWGRIIYLSSVLTKRNVVGTCAYTASKAGLEGLTGVLAAENASRGVTVNCLQLGYFDTGLINTVPNQRELLDQIPARTFGRAGEIADVIRSLIVTPYVNGAILPITGGL